MDQHKWRVFATTDSGTWGDAMPEVFYRETGVNQIDFHAQPSERSGNPLGSLHGGFMAGLAESVLGLFLVAAHGTANCVTVSLSFDYPGAGRVGLPVSGQLHLMRETGRMQFVRIVLEQEDVVLLHGNGVLRKISLP